jgi:hypothetical protein
MNQYSFEGFAEVVKKAQSNGVISQLKNDIESAAFMGKKSLVVDQSLNDESIEQLVTEGFIVTKLPDKLVINWEDLS